MATQTKTNQKNNKSNTQKAVDTNPGAVPKSPQRPKTASKSDNPSSKSQSQNKNSKSTSDKS